MPTAIITEAKQPRAKLEHRSRKEKLLPRILDDITNRTITRTIPPISHMGVIPLPFICNLRGPNLKAKNIGMVK